MVTRGNVPPHQMPRFLRSISVRPPFRGFSFVKPDGLRYATRLLRSSIWLGMVKKSSTSSKPTRNCCKHRAHHHLRLKKEKKKKPKRKKRNTKKHRRPYKKHEARLLFTPAYIQPLDFFGDGPRIRSFWFSPFSRGGTSATPTPTTSRIRSSSNAIWNLSL